jgi:Ni/Fe-hydrogenase subunit HybB-like protein
MNEVQLPQKRKFPTGLAVLTALVVLGLIPVVIRYIYGLGAMSHLSDGRPWGLWISFDLYCGVALAAGGFTLAGAVYVFRLEKFHSVTRPAVLTAFLGYTLVILALLVDLGQPWFIWHIFVSPNIHSPLFEVGICVVSYTAVLALEFSPAVFEKFNWHVPLKVVRAIQIPLVILGVCLSTLHQSSLGSMLLISQTNLHALWYTPILPLLFLNSAIAVGPAMVMFESTLTGKALGHKVSHEIMEGLGKAIPVILGIYLVLKIAGMGLNHSLGLIFTAYPYNLYWWAEVIIGIITPIVLFTNKSFRKSDTRLFWGASIVVLGLILNRFNVSMFALAMRPGYSYFPSWMEFAISAGLVADSMLVIWLAYRLLPMMQHEPGHAAAPGTTAR